MHKKESAFACECDPWRHRVSEGRWRCERVAGAKGGGRGKGRCGGGWGWRGRERGGLDQTVRHTDTQTHTKTATLCPSEVRCKPSASIKVDLPAPGGPDSPTRKDDVLRWNSFFFMCAASALKIRDCACSLWSGRVDSTVCK